MNGRIFCSVAWLLFVVPFVLVGCTRSDDEEYRVYSPDDGSSGNAGSAVPQSEAVSPQPQIGTAPTADATIIDEGDEAHAESVTVETGDGEREPVADAGGNSGSVGHNSTGDVPPGPRLALTPEQQAELDAIAAQAPVEETPSEPREIKLLVPEKTFKKEGPEGAIRVSYDDLDLLKVLNMEPVTAGAPEHFPSWLKDLDGKRIRLRGYMRPDVLAEDLPFFVLARDTQACCFGPNTKPYDIIPTIMREGVTTDYIHLQPFDIVGNFHINIEMDLDDPNKVEFLYYIDDAVVIQK